MSPHPTLIYLCTLLLGSQEASEALLYTVWRAVLCMFLPLSFLSSSLGVLSQSFHKYHLNCLKCILPIVLPPRSATTLFPQMLGCQIPLAIPRQCWGCERPRVRSGTK